MINPRRFKTACLTLSLALSLSSGAAFGAEALSADRVYALVSPSIWMVHVQNAQGRTFSLGSAVVIGPESMVTNCHVLAKGQSISVVYQGTRLTAQLEYPDPERDLCQLKVPKLPAPPVAIAPMASLRVGQRVFAIGNPQGLALTLSDGLVSSLRLNKAGQLQRIQTSAPISSGSSGGGLFDDEGRLIGITSSGIVADDGSSAQNLNFAIPAGWLAELPTRGQDNLAAWKAKTAASDAAAGTGNKPEAPGTAATRNPALLKAIEGQWTGKYACGPYQGNGRPANPEAWSRDVNMEVTGEQVTIVRAQKGVYQETLKGQLTPDLMIGLQGRGDYDGEPSRNFTSVFFGLFYETTAGTSFTAAGELRMANSNVRIRQCTIDMKRPHL